MSPSTTYDAQLKTPVGVLGIVLASGGLSEIRFLGSRTPEAAPVGPLAAEVVRQLQRYFAADDWRFELPLATPGTLFQRRVWDALQRIPPGSVRSYGELGRELGGGARAVGNACRANPCPIVVPCHRVVGCRGLGGYGGETQGRNVEVKRWLLRHEGWDGGR